MTSVRDALHLVGKAASIQQLAHQRHVSFPLSLRQFVGAPPADSMDLTLEIPFHYGEHNLTFVNFTIGSPSWDTFEETFGAAEVYHELLDPFFGHPILTTAFYFFYRYFLKGEGDGGLATGFCTSLAALVADKFWKGDTDAPALTLDDGLRQHLTSVHGKLLSRESLTTFHDQGRQGIARVEETAREIEATFLRGCDRRSAPLLFFIPSGEVWDSGYSDKLGASHCVMPYRFAYSPSHPAHRLSSDGKSTISNLDGVELYVWDCNRPTNPNCKLRFRFDGNTLHFDYFNGGGSIEFSSNDGITLGMMTNGSYQLDDHDLPFSGPHGLTRFIIEFLLSPADLQVTNAQGLRTGNFGGQILSEIPGSHPCYLMPGMYMLPPDATLTRRITGTGSGTYSFNSIAPDGSSSIVLEDVPTAHGQEDVLAISGDRTQIRFTSSQPKPVNLTIAQRVGDQTRALAVSGVMSAPGQDAEIAIAPELSGLRMGNQGSDRNIEVKAFAFNHTTKALINKQLPSMNLAARQELQVAVMNWNTLDLKMNAHNLQ